MNVVFGAELILFIDKSQLELGHNSKAELYAINLSEKITDINFTELEQNFAVIIDETAGDVEDDRWPGQDIQLVELRLYPRQTGTFTVPSLELDGVQSQPQKIQVLPGVDDKNSTIEQTVILSSTEVWQRQRVTLVVELITQDTFVTLRAEEDLTLNGFEIIPIEASREKIVRDGSKYLKLRIGWIFFPLVEGEFTINIPGIEYVQSSQTRRSYFIKNQLLIVKALPPYIPPTMPVGEIRLSSSLRGDAVLHPDKISYWDITITGRNVSPSWIPTLLAQITAGKAVTMYKPITEQHTSIIKNVLQSQILHHIPFKAINNGSLQLPDLALQYFDPRNAKIIKVIHRAPSAYGLNLPWRITLGALISFLLLWIGKKTVVKLTTVVRRVRNRRLAFSALAKAESVLDLRQSLNLIAKAEGWQGNMTLQQWQLRWQTHYRRRDGLSTLLQQISEACYGSGSQFDLAACRRSLIIELQSETSILTKYFYITRRECQ